MAVDVSNSSVRNTYKQKRKQNEGTINFNSGLEGIQALLMIILSFRELRDS